METINYPTKMHPECLRPQELQLVARLTTVASLQYASLQYALLVGLYHRWAV